MVDPSATEEAPPAPNGVPTPRDMVPRRPPPPVPAGGPRRGPAAPSAAPVAPPVQQMTAGQLAELLQDVEAGTPVWQLDEDDNLVAVYFVEISRVNGLVEKLVLR